MSTTPPTEEWTPEYVDSRVLGKTGGVVPWNLIVKIADAHNAALAAANTAAEEFFRTNGILTKQLAAERERSKELSEDLNHMQDKLDAAYKRGSDDRTAMIVKQTLIEKQEGGD